MESGIQSSFIPRDAAIPTPMRGGSRGGLSDFFLLVAVILFAASAALAVAVFLYDQFLGQQGTSKVSQLQATEAAFQPSLIEQLTRLDNRMQAAQTILSSHLAPSVFFQALQQSTLKTVSFRDLTFTVADATHIKITMTGVAQSVNSIAYQAGLFSQNGVITDPIFSNISRQADGVHFNFEGLVNPSALNYEQLTGAQAPAGATSQPQTTQQQTQTPTQQSPFGSPQSTSTPPAPQGSSAPQGATQ